MLAPLGQGGHVLVSMGAFSPAPTKGALTAECRGRQIVRLVVSGQRPAEPVCREDALCVERWVRAGRKTSVISLGNRPCTAR